MSDGLLERDDETRALLALVDHSAAGRGGCRVVEGPAGIGKSALLAATREYALARGVRPLVVYASEFEGEVAFGVVADLLGPAGALPASVRDRAGADRSALADVGADPRASLVALHAAVAALAATEPLLLCVDDVQWADAASLRFLAFHARRLATLPVALLLTLRTPAAAPPRPPLGELLAATRERSIRPRPLSAAGSAALVRARWSEQVGDDLCTASHEATAGNPYLLAELVAALRQDGVDPRAMTIPRALAIGARAVAPLVLQRLERLPPDAIELARGIAVAGEVGEPAEVARVLGLDPAAGTAATQALVAADVLDAAEPARFVHPLVRSAIWGSVAPARRAELALAAARRLNDDGRVEAAAASLLGVPARGDAAIAETLTEAARLARTRGAPDVAATLLARALEEPPLPARRGAVLTALGEAQRALGDPAGVATLRAALAEAGGARERALVARTLALALLALLQVREAIAVLDDAIAGLRRGVPDPADAELAEELEALVLHHASWDPALRGLVVERLGAPGAPPRIGASERAYRARCVAMALESVASCRPAEEGADLAERGLATGALLAWEPGVHCAGALILTACGRTDRARAHLDEVVAATRAAGDVLTPWAARVLRAAATLADGDVAAAEADARTTLDEEPVDGGVLVFAVLQLLIAQANVPAAERVLRERALLGPMPDRTPFNTALHARGGVRIAAGSVRAGLEDVLLAGARQEAVGHLNPALIGWRADAAEALLELGDVAQARSIAQIGLERARAFGAARPLGSALRVAGRVALHEDGVAGSGAGEELLHAAIAELEGSHARGELALARLSLAEALLSRGEQAAAREQLALAERLASRLGAIALRERIVAALVTAGGRPRGAARGAGELTRAERRVAELAVSGATNAEIARTLVVSVKTVETHLSRTYRKLCIGSRTQLAALLDDE